MQLFSQCSSALCTVFMATSGIGESLFVIVSIFDLVDVHVFRCVGVEPRPVKMVGNGLNIHDVLSCLE